MTGNEGLAELRASIDNIDAALVHLLAERFRLTKQVGIYKAAHDLPPADPEREKVQLARLRRLAEGRRPRSRLRREVLRIHRQGSDPPPRSAALVRATKQHPRSE